MILQNMALKSCLGGGEVYLFSKMSLAARKIFFLSKLFSEVTSEQQKMTPKRAATGEEQEETKVSLRPGVKRDF